MLQEATIKQTTTSFASKYIHHVSESSVACAELHGLAKHSCLKTLLMQSCVFVYVQVSHQQ